MSLISATVISDSVHPNVKTARITTFEVVAPRFLLAEVNTHGVIARSAASSRAIPVGKRRAEIAQTMFVPDRMYYNQPGMKGSVPLTPDDRQKAVNLWRDICFKVLDAQQSLIDLNLHKQHANRIAEPWAYYKGVMTATEWDNFFALRISSEAQPEFDELARAMQAAMNDSIPVRRRSHMPYADDLDHAEVPYDDRLMVSVARCARVSYKTFDGKPSTIEADKELYQQLLTSRHMSPFNHVAHTDGARYDPQENSYYWTNPEAQERFWGWISERYYIEKALKLQSRRSSFDPIATGCTIA